MAVLNRPFHTRLAPTPSGWLHAGNGTSFLITWLLARASEGTVLLRIDDLDRARQRDEYVEDIFRTIDWLEIDYDRGPSGPDDLAANWSQLHRLPSYEQALLQLREEEVLYACTCSRKRIRAHRSDGIYPGLCRNRRLPLDRPNTAWRVRIPQGFMVPIDDLIHATRSVDLSRSMNDFVVRQKDGFPAYQIASLVDDRYFDIDGIVRGADLLDSTAAQIWLADQLGWPEFRQSCFLHHALQRDETGTKLSKSQGALALKHWRDQKRSPAPLWQQAGEWLGLEELALSDKASGNEWREAAIAKTKGRYC